MNVIFGSLTRQIAQAVLASEETPKENATKK